MKWISIDERLPDPGSTVLTWHYADSPADSIRIGRFRGNQRWTSVPGLWELSGVKYWMPLPEEPQ